MKRKLIISFTVDDPRAKREDQVKIECLMAVPDCKTNQDAMSVLRKTLGDAPWVRSITPAVSENVGKETKEKPDGETNQAHTPQKHGVK